jgi:hypothetical protein
MAIERIEADLREIYGSRPWLVAADALPAAAGTIARLRAYGSPRCFAIAARHGTGDLPPAADCEYHVLGLPPMPMMEAILAAEEALRDLPPSVQEAVERFDPKQELRAIGAIFSDGRPVAGRAFWGARRPSWRALEDKTVVDALWDEAGVERVPCEVVPLEPEVLALASARLDQGLGTVWAGDAQRGFHGGATYTCWVHDAETAQRARRHLASRCSTARIMPFLEGIPCSIHGMVFGAREPVLVLRPAEMLTLRRSESPTGFLYARVATFWDPSALVREQMRQVARRVGQHLQSRYDYRGAFTVDGVCTREGFRPTELNPRVGAALGLMVPGFPFSLLHDVLVEGVGGGWDIQTLEEELLEMADRTRRGAIGFLTEKEFPEPVSRRLRWTGEGWVAAGAHESAEGELVAGPGAAGGFVQVKLAASTGVGGRIPVGPSVGPLAAAAVAYADRELGTGIGPVQAAVDLTHR